MVESKEQALNPQTSEQVLNSFHEWMVQRAQVKSTNQPAQPSDLDNYASRKGSYFSPSIASEPSIQSSSSATQENRVGHGKQANITPGASNGSSVERRVFRIICGLLITVVVAVVWQAYRDDQTMKLVRAWGNSSMIWLSAALGATQRESETAAEPSTELSDQAASTPAVTLTPTKEFTELNQQLQTVVNDLAVLRRNNYLRDRSRCLETFPQCRRSSRMLAKKYLLSLRLRLFPSRREKTSQGLSTRKHQGNQLQHPARRSHRLPERHRPTTNRLVLPCRCLRLLKYLRPSIESMSEALLRCCP